MNKFFMTMFLFTLLTVISCGKNQYASPIQEIVKDDIKTIAKAKIFFGHQSVGQNIMDGLSRIVAASNDTSLNITDAYKSRQLPEFYFIHTKIGQNRKPQTKCRDFAGIIERRLAKNGLQYAFLKFCFVDITDKTNIIDVFNRYRQTMDSLKAHFPKIHFIHFTVPLQSKTKGIRASIKRIFGITGQREENNIQRFKYNQLLKKYYHDEPIFDIAKMESTYPDGSRETFTKQGKLYFTMIERYTSDGGHLNDYGRKMVASKLIIFLANLINSNK